MPISPRQRAIEAEAARLRSELNLTDSEPLEQHRALALIRNCSVSAIKNIPGLDFEWISHFRLSPNQVSAFAHRRPDDGHYFIVFNDAHPPPLVRVYLMEEYFHIRLGHPPDIVRLYPLNGAHRSYNEIKENEAYGCGLAALLPFHGVSDMLSTGYDLRRIAERYVVPVEAVEERMTLARLSHLIRYPSRQLSLLSGR
jgi:hypothetical protein